MEDEDSKTVAAEDSSRDTAGKDSNIEPVAEGAVEVDTGKGKEDSSTEADIAKWKREHSAKFESFYPDISCNHGLDGGPFRGKNRGSCQLHYGNYHKEGEISAEPKASEDKREKGKKEPKGEVDSMTEIIRKTEAADLRGKLIRAMKRIKKLPKDSQEILAGEYEMVSHWKNETTKKEFDEEKQNYISAQLSSVVLPILEEFEEEHKTEKKVRVEKKSKRERDDDYDAMDDINEQMRYGMMQERVEAMEDRREEREARRRRREEREEEEHQARLEAKKHGGGAITPFGTPGQGGYAYTEEVTFKHKEDGTLALNDDGKPIPHSVKKTPVHPMALMQPPAPKSGDGGSPLLTMMKEANEAAREEAKESREITQNLIKELAAEKDRSRDTAINGKFNELTGAINSIAKKADTDPLTEYLKMEDTLKDKGIFRGGESPESKKIDLQIEQEKSHKELMIKELDLGFGMINTLAGKLSDGVLAKSLAKKIDEGLPAGQEEELPDDAALEAEMEDEVRVPQEIPADQGAPPTKKRGKKKKGRQ